MIGALAQGTSEIVGFLDAADTRSTLNCLRSLGAEFRRTDSHLVVNGRGLQGLQPALDILQAGNSGTTMRLLTGILVGQPFISRITGDESLNSRPMKRIIDPLTEMGATIQASPRFTAPLTISGSYPLHPIEYRMPIVSAQVKSAILFAGLFADGVTRLIESNATRDHTERMLALETTQTTDGRIITVQGGSEIQPRRFVIPGDISSAAFLIAAALLVPGSELRLSNVGLNPTRTRVLDILRSLRGQIQLANERVEGGEPLGDIIVRYSELRGALTLEGPSVAELIDEIPILATTAALGGVDFVLKDASELRHKESDRIRAMVMNLRRLGLDVTESDDGFAFHGKKSLIPGEFESFGDHRVAMAFGVAGLALKGESLVKNAECVEISYPEFWQTLQSIQQR